MRGTKTVIHIVSDPCRSDSGGAMDCVSGFQAVGFCHQDADRAVVIGSLSEEMRVVPNPLGRESELIYSTFRPDNAQCVYAENFERVEDDFGISIVYGRKKIGCGSVEMILLDVSRCIEYPVDALKRWLYDEFGLESLRYESDSAYNRAIAMGPSSLAVLRSLDLADPVNPALLIAHDALGIPTALAGVLDPLGVFKSVYYAHKVEPVERVIRNHPGHDTMFYNVMNAAIPRSCYLGDLFGSQDFFYDLALINAARFCDGIWADSGQVADELLFCSPHLGAGHIDRVPRVMDAQPSSADQVAQWRDELMTAVDADGTDWILGHLGDLSTRDGLWRDLAVMRHLESQLAHEDRKVVLLVKPTAYAIESHVFDEIEQFNKDHDRVRVVWADGVRTGALLGGCDAMLALGIYQPLSGHHLRCDGLCVTTSTCPVALADGAMIVADYVTLDGPVPDVATLIGMDRTTRDAVEGRAACEVACRLIDELKAQADRAEPSAVEHDADASVVAGKFLAAIEMVWHRRRSRRIA